jgi:hypothetical protein
MPTPPSAPAQKFFARAKSNHCQKQSAMQMDINIQAVPLPSATTGMSSWALAYASIDYFIFPLAPGTKFPLQGSHGHHDATTDPALIQEWWRLCRSRNVALNCKKSGIVALDLDRHDADGVANFQTLAGYEPLPLTPTALTGNIDDQNLCGFHYIFKHPEVQFKQNLDETFGFKCNIDFKSNGYILLEPSVRKDGRRYKWLNKLSPFECLPAPFPEWLLKYAAKAPPILHATSFNRFRRSASEYAQEALRALWCIPADVDYHKWLKIGMALKRNGYPVEEWDRWSQQSRTKYHSGECQRKWRTFD